MSRNGYPYPQMLSHERGDYPAPNVVLTTDQVERLAKAGVAVELANKVVVQDPPSEPTPPSPFYGNDISQGIRERYMQSLRAKETRVEREKRRQLEMERGQFVLAKKALAREFDPDYIEENEGPKISTAERLRRDKYRNRMQAQVKK